MGPFYISFLSLEKIYDGMDVQDWYYDAWTFQQSCYSARAGRSYPSFSTVEEKPTLSVTLSDMYSKNTWGEERK